MRLKDNARFWDVRFDILAKKAMKQADGSSIDYDITKHQLASVAAESIVEAIDLVKTEWPTATIWQVNNHGRECHVLVADSLRD